MFVYLPNIDIHYKETYFTSLMIINLLFTRSEGDITGPT